MNRPQYKTHTSCVAGVGLSAQVNSFGETGQLVYHKETQAGGLCGSFMW